MSKTRHTARHRAAPTNPLRNVAKAASSGVSTVGRPAAVAVAVSGLMLGSTLPANAGATSAPSTTTPQQLPVIAVTQTVGAAAPVAAVPTVGATHTVQSGDTLGKIAASYGVSLDSIFALNGLGWESIIYPGDLIALTGAATGVSGVTAPAAPARVETSTMGITTAASTIERAPAQVSNTAAASSVGAALVASAYAQMGATQDCTILVEVALRSIGKSVGDLAPEQFYQYGTVVGSPVPGDLVIRPGHVAIYVGNGQVISSGMNGVNATILHPLSDLAGSSFVRVSS
ncbi:Cell wall-associated hydrolase, NlpC family [Arthrobacter subterraneus]|uniref:Cell wall-associated hydrolase, NlpC family n=1 Tax=Arthrobacter subterraneus TaxID=335973 RepID=A0A1G8NNM7_9MICC|nr:LysM peptidoglycan-binding domain-containing protein [Arthrobacter subterraneus]SDI81813.1 Cell wall-associated hydrolase, NlpC family [Arthrobacter subterraneus]